MNIGKVLVGLDRKSESSSPVYEMAVRLAEKEHAHLMLIYCLSRFTLAELEGRVGAVTEMEGSDALTRQDQWLKRESEHIQAWLEGLCREARVRGVKADAVVEVGQPGPSMTALAERWGADLIVLGRTQKSALGDLISGSVSNYVIHHAPCSVLFVHEGAAQEDQSQPIP